MKQINIKDLIELIYGISNGKAELGLYQFEQYKIHLRPLHTMSNAERQRIWHKLHKQEINKERRSTYQDKKKIQLCVKCYGAVKATHGRLCNYHHGKLRKGKPLKYKKVYPQ